MQIPGHYPQAGIPGLRRPKRIRRQYPAEFGSGIEAPAGDFEVDDQPFEMDEHERYLEGIFRPYNGGGDSHDLEGREVVAAS